MRKRLSWQAIEDTAVRLFGDEGFSRSESKTSAIIVADKVIVGIFIWDEKSGFFHYHPRAAVRADFTAYIAASFAVEGIFMVSDVIEPVEGKLLHGIEAHRYAIKKESEALKAKQHFDEVGQKSTDASVSPQDKGTLH